MAHSQGRAPHSSNRSQPRCRKKIRLGQRYCLGSSVDCLTIRSSRGRFAATPPCGRLSRRRGRKTARLNSGVRPHKSPCNPHSASRLFSCFSGSCSQLLTCYPHPGVMIYCAHASQCSHTGCVNKAFSTIFFAPHMTSSMYGGGFSSSQYRHLLHWPQHSHFGGLRPNNSSKPTPLRGAA